MKSYPVPRLLTLIVAATCGCWFFAGCGSSQTDEPDADPTAAKSDEQPAATAQAKAPSDQSPAPSGTTKSTESTAPSSTSPAGSTPASETKVVTVDETPRPPATVAEASKRLDLRTFPLMDGAIMAENRIQVGTLRYEAPAPVQEAFDFQRRELEKLGWKMLPGGRLDGENPGADFTREGYVVSTSVSAYGTDPDNASIYIRNNGNVLVGKLSVPDGAEPFYGDVTRASYVTTADKAPTAEAVWKMFADDGWKPYGHAGDDMRYFKKNAILISANVMSHEAQPGKTFITYSSEVLSADLPVSADIEDPDYTDGMKRLHYDQTGDTVNQTVEFYNRELGALGWKPTTSEPVGDDPVMMIYRNDAKDMVSLEMQRFNEITRVDVTHHTAAELAELERQHAEAVAERERKENEPADKIAIPVPGNLKSMTQEDAEQLDLVATAGTGRQIAEAYHKWLKDAGWEIENANFEKEFGDIVATKGNMRMNIDYTDIGFGDDAEIEIWAMNAALVPDKQVPSFAASGGQAAAGDVAKSPPAKLEGGRLHGSNFPVPAGAKEVERHSDTEMVIFRSDMAPTKIGEFYRDQLRKLGWKDDPDEAFLDDELGVGGIGFFTDDHELRVVIQDGKPESTTRVLVMGDGIVWGDAESEPSPDAEPREAERLPAGPFVAGAGKGEGKIFYDGEETEMKYALAIQRKEDGEDVTRLILCAEPFAKGALAKLGDEDSFLFDLFEDGFPACIDIHLNESYASITCLLDGSSINLGSDKIKSTVTRTGNKLAGRVYLEEPKDFFDKPFRFDVNVDVDIQDGAAIEAPAAEQYGELAADSKHSVLIPEGCEEVFQEGSPYLEITTAGIRIDFDKVLAFYQAATAAQGWKPVAAATKQAAESATLAFTTDDGPVTVELSRRGGKTRIVLTQRDEKLAREHGMIPPAGKALVIVGNATESAMVITIDGKEHRLTAGQGAEDPMKALKVTIAAGKHSIGVKGGKTESVDVPAGATWGFFVIDGGDVFSDRVY